MRNCYTLLILLFLQQTVFGQTPEFSFSDSVGSYNSLTNPVRPSVSPNDNDANGGIDEYYVNALPIGFNFNYRGTNYASLNVNNNGYVALTGAFNATDAYYSPNLASGSTTNALRPIIAPFWADNSCDTLQYQLTGSAPNRILTIEWKGVKWSYGALSPTMSVQLKLYETSNIIRFIYKQETTNPTGTGAQIGITSGATGSGSYLSVQSLTSPSSVSSNAVASFNIRPADGQVFTFRPLVPCSGAVVAGTIGSSSSAVCAGETFLLTNAGYTTGFSGLRYQWQRSVDGGTTWANIANGNNPDSVRVTLTQTTRYRFVDTCITGPTTAISNVVTVNVNSAGAVTYAPIGSGYVQDFEAWQDGCAAGGFALPDVNWRNKLEFGDSSWRRNDQGATANWNSLSFGASTPNFRSGQYSARLHTYAMTAGTTGDLSAYFNMSGSGSSNYRVGFAYRNISSSATNNPDSLELWLSTNGGSSFTKLGGLKTSSTWSLQAFNFSSTSAQTIIRLRGYAGTDFGGDIFIDSFYVERLNNCTGAPSGGNAAATVSSLCAGERSVIYNQGYSAAQGINGFSYQWESSTNNGTTWTAIAGANNPDSLVVRPNSTTSYRLRVACSFSGLTGVSNVEVVTVNNSPVYATLGTGVSEDFELWESSCGTSDRPGANWSTTPITGNTAWRRNDEGASANWVSPTSWTYTPASKNGTYSARFHSGEVLSRGTGSMSFHVNAASAAYIQVGFYTINTSGSDSITVEASRNGGTSFTRLGVVASQTTGWRSVIFDYANPSATTIIRLTATGDYGTTDIGVDSLFVRPATPCTGTPAGGTASTPASFACSGVGTKIFASGFSPSNQVGISYQWQVSTNSGTNWANVSNANTPDSLVASQTVSSQYRLRVNCSLSGDSAFSNIISLNLGTPAPVYATLGTGVGEDFENWVSGCRSAERPSASWLARVVSGNASWRRDDQGVSEGGWGGAAGAYSPTSFSGNYSARFHSDFTSDSSSLSYHVNAASNPAIAISFYHINVDGTDSVVVLASNNGGASFTRLGRVGVSAGWTRYQFGYTAANATTVIRLRAHGDFGNSDIGIDSFRVAPAAPCSGTPQGGSAFSNTSQVCAGSTALVEATNYSRAETAGVGITYQWQTSFNGTTWQSLANGNNPDSVRLEVNAPQSVRLLVGCAASGFSAATTPVQLSLTDLPTYATVGTGILEDFESWNSSSCGVNDRPNANVNNTPATGDRSWRRNDEGSTAGWRTPADGSFGATPSGSYAARFHSYWAPSGTTGTLDFYLNAGTPSNVLSFLHVNQEGNDSMRVSVSTDGGSTFTRLAIYFTTFSSTSWVRRTINIPNATATTIVRFQVFSDYGNSDVGLDSVYFRPATTVPLSLEQFNGERRNNVNQLSWTTLSEQGVKGFEVERALANDRFVQIGFVASQAVNGNSNRKLIYGYADAIANNEVARYRLRMVDLDGRFSYSPVVEIKPVTVSGLQIASIYPNPVTSQLNVRISSSIQSKATLIVMDAQGRTVLQQAIQLTGGSTVCTLNTGSLALGNYRLRLVCANGCDSDALPFMKH